MMMAERKKTHYEVLGVSPAAPFREIKAAFMSLAKKLHPDKGDSTDEDVERFSGITEAYRVLSDSVSRYVYDMELGIEPESDVIPVAGRLGEPTVTGNAAADYVEELLGGIPFPALRQAGDRVFEIPVSGSPSVMRAYTAGLYSFSMLENLPMRKYYESGSRALQKKKYGAAVFFLSEAVSMNPRNLQYRFALGAALEGKGMRARASGEYREVIRLGGLKGYDCLPVREALIRVLTEAGDYRSAKEEAREVMRRGLKSLAAEGALRLARVIEKKESFRRK